MDSFSDLFKKENMGQVILCILFIIYLIMGYRQLGHMLLKDTCLLKLKNQVI